MQYKGKTMAIAKKPTAPRSESVSTRDDRADAFIARAGQAQEPADDGRRIPVTMRYDREMLKRTDAAAKRLGISRSAYVHIALSRLLDQEP
jgi:hypothetical protein